MDKNDVALIQLERSMRLFLDEQDYISSITLAGAAEEILGKQLKDRPNALEELVEVMAIILEKRGEQIGKKQIEYHLNYPRNSLKHLKVGDRDDLNFPVMEAASKLIERAVSNYIKVTSYYPDEELYKRFVANNSCGPHTTKG